MNRFLKWTGFFIGGAAGVLGLYLLVIQLVGNFAPVIPGEVYRSNQPTAAEIAVYAARYKIRTIVNLRGRDANAPWYIEEADAARKLGVTLVDFPMQADHRLDARAVGKLTALLRDAEHPLLIHCRSGADRTGLASVIYLARIANVDEETAEQQLSVRFGHIGIPYLSPTYAMDESWEDMEHAEGDAS